MADGFLQQYNNVPSHGSLLIQQYSSDEDYIWLSAEGKKYIKLEAQSQWD